MKAMLNVLLLFIVGGLIGQSAQAQSKLSDVKKSALIGLPLPEGSKQDKRSLSVAGAKALLEMVGNKAGVKIINTEVFYLLPESVSQFNNETLKAQIQETGWNLYPVPGEPEYYWLEQNGRYVLAYYKSGKKDINLYLADTDQAPGMPITQRDNPPPPNQPDTQHGGSSEPPLAPTHTQGNSNVNIFSSNNTYAYTTTNFDDGWNSTVQADWVEVTKGNIKVLLHYPKEGTIIPADPEPHINNAWNILIAPRYSSLTNYKTAYITTYNRPYLGMGTVTDPTGASHFLVLFRQGQTGWIECITPDKNTFIQQFRFDPEKIQWDSETELLNTVSSMANYNKFAVASSDFNGVWTSDFTGMQQLYNVYTGNYAGMNINQSRETFEFTGNGSYVWKLLAVNGMVGNMSYANVGSKGSLQVLNNWQVSCSDIEGKPKKYHAFFSCIKGARLLHLLDADFPGNGTFTIYGKK